MPRPAPTRVRRPRAPWTLTILVARLQTQSHEHLPGRVATKTTRTRPSLVSLGIHTRPLRPHLQVRPLHVRCQPALRTNPSNWRPLSLAPLTVSWSVFVKLAQWYRIRLTAHPNQHIRMVCSQHHGQPNRWYRLSKQEQETVSRHRSRLRWALRPQDTTLHRHLVPAVRKLTTSCPAFANRPSSRGASPASTALLPTMREESLPEKLPRLQASRSGQTMRIKPHPVAPSRHLIRNDERRHRCLGTLDFVAFDQRDKEVMVTSVMSITYRRFYFPRPLPPRSSNCSRAQTELRQCGTDSPMTSRKISAASVAR